MKKGVDAIFCRGLLGIKKPQQDPSSTKNLSPEEINISHDPKLEVRGAPLKIDKPKMKEKVS